MGKNLEKKQGQRVPKSNAADIYKIERIPSNNVEQEEGGTDGLTDN